MRNYPLFWVLLFGCAPIFMDAQRGYTATGPSPCTKSPTATTIQPGDAVYVKGWSGDYERMIYKGSNLPAPWGGTVAHYIHRPDNVNSLYSLPDGAHLSDYVITESAYQALDPTQGACALCCTADYSAVFKAELFELINDYRHANGKAPLAFDPVLDEAAQDYAEVGASMPSRALADGHRADGTTHDQRILRVAKKYNYTLRENGGEPRAFAGPTGENVVVFGKYCASDAFERWKRSAAHDWQMKFEGHRHIGIGVACGLREDGSTFLFAVNKFAPLKWDQNTAPTTPNPTAMNTGTDDPAITTPTTPVNPTPVQPAPGKPASTTTGGYTATGTSPCEAPAEAVAYNEGDVIYMRNFNGGYDRMIYAGRNKNTSWGVLEHHIHEPGDPEAIMLLPQGSSLADRSLSEAEYQARNSGVSPCKTCCTADYAELFKGQLLRTLNDYRAANGSGPLAYDAALDLAAQRYADYAARDYNKTLSSQHFADGRSPDDRMLEAAKELGYPIKDMGGFELPYDGKMGENAVIFNRLCASEAFATWKGSPGHDRQMKNAEHRLIGIGVACGVKPDGQPFLFAVNKFAHAKWPGVDTSPATTGVQPKPTPGMIPTPAGPATTEVLTGRGNTGTPAENPGTTAPGMADCTEVENYAVWYDGAMTQHNRLPVGYCMLSPNRQYALAVTRAGELTLSRVATDFDSNGQLYVQTCNTLWRAPVAATNGTLRVTTAGNLCLEDAMGSRWCALEGADAGSDAKVSVDNKGQLRIVDAGGWKIWSVGGE